ncbi:glycosyltransferase family 2 protein [Shewanella xiamenensis]|uniref:glycosyltransferase family 2 protein n=1 Tax=Shewanella xiamenensis TaxID=332186 RepID=UPI00313E1E63
MHANKISIIGTSQGGRGDLIVRMLESLSYCEVDLEVVFVDQSSDNNIEKIFNDYKHKVNFKLIKSGKISLSKARNIAVSNSTGNLLTFCDDDAFYDAPTLSKIISYVEVRPLIISTRVIDKAKNTNYSGRQFPCKLSKLNQLDILRFCLSVGTFILAKNNDWIRKHVVFNERLGVGAEIGGSEESELILRLNSSGLDVIFNPELIVYHDDDFISEDSSLVLGRKYYKYAVGYGLILKVFLFKSKLLLLLELLNISIRCIVGLVISKRRAIHFYRLLGVWNGFLFKKL